MKDGDANFPTVGAVAGATTDTHAHVLSDAGQAALRPGFSRYVASSWTANFNNSFPSAGGGAGVQTLGIALVGSTDSVDSSTLQPSLALTPLIKT